jgi:hypothetical protein
VKFITILHIYYVHVVATWQTRSEFMQTIASTRQQTKRVTLRGVLLSKRRA